MVKKFFCIFTNAFVLNIFTALLRHKKHHFFTDFHTVMEEYKKNLGTINTLLFKKLCKKDRKTFINFMLKHMLFIDTASEQDLKRIDDAFDKTVGLYPPPVINFARFSYFAKIYF